MAPPEMKFTHADIIDGFLQILGLQSAAQKQKERKDSIDAVLKEALHKYDPAESLQHTK